MSKIPHLKISHGLDMVTKILRPCLGKLLDFVNLMIFTRWNLLKHFKDALNDISMVCLFPYPGVL